MEKGTTVGCAKIAALFDAGTFVETGAFMKRGDDLTGVVCGYGAVDGKLVYAFAQDSDRRKGAFDALQAEKIASLYTMAVKNGAPVVGVFDSAGAILSDGASAMSAYGKLLKTVSDASGVIPQIALAQGFGRIGCFLAGCCYGKPTDSHFGVVFPVEAIAPSGIPLIPTQLISAAGDFLIFAILLLLSYFATDYLKVRKGEEELLDKDAVTKKLRFFQPLSMSGMYLILYGIGRFAIEFLRADPRRTALGLTSNQYVSIVFVIAGLALIFYGYKRAQKGPCH